MDKEARQHSQLFALLTVEQSGVYRFFAVIFRALAVRPTAARAL